MASNVLQLADRLQWISLQGEEPEQTRGQEVIRGLNQSPKTLPCRYFYDDYGSRLFEEITALPEYYLTRTEQSILERFADAIAQWTGPCDLIELGSGSSSKTRLLLSAYQKIDARLLYCPIDVSAGILKQSAVDLLEQYPDLSVLGLAGTYEQAMKCLPTNATKPKLLLFLGSTLGNMSDQSSEPEESEQSLFLRQISDALQPGDFFLLGVDLQKPVEIIEAAYNDAQGVTAEFNLNILTHLNRVFCGNFQRHQFEHLAQYNAQRHQIEMKLRSRCDQTVDLQALGYCVQIHQNEWITTEISRKFNVERLKNQLAQLGLQPTKIWTDPKQWFAVLLCQKA